MLAAGGGFGIEGCRTVSTAECPPRQVVPVEGEHRGVLVEVAPQGTTSSRVKVITQVNAAAGRRRPRRSGSSERDRFGAHNGSR